MTLGGKDLTGRSDMSALAPVSTGVVRAYMGSREAQCPVGRRTIMYESWMDYLPRVVWEAE